ncbi:MAG: hypothetical protein ABH885_04780 [Candidatus Omnitrophota bacterium]
MRKGDIQYRYLESMRLNAVMMNEKLSECGGAHITLLGVGPSDEGHIGFGETGLPRGQGCFIGSVNLQDATSRIAIPHSKEIGGLREFFRVAPNGRLMPRHGFITYGPREFFMRKDGEVIVIATSNSKSGSVRRALEEGQSERYPLSLIGESGGVVVLEAASARDLGLFREPWDYQVLPKEYWAREHDRENLCQIAEAFGCKIAEIDPEAIISRAEESLAQAHGVEREVLENRIANFKAFGQVITETGRTFEEVKRAVIEAISSSLITPAKKPMEEAVIEAFEKKYKVKKGSTVVIVNPHMDDDFLALTPEFLSILAKNFNIKVYYTSYGYTAVYSEYALGMIELAVNMLGDGDFHRFSPEREKELLEGLIKELPNGREMPRLDLDVIPYMSENEKKLRAQLLVLRLNKRYNDAFLSKKSMERLLEFLREVDKRKPKSGGVDISAMQFIKTALRFTEATSSLMFKGIKYENVYWPLNVSFYGTPGRSLALNREDINTIKGIFRHSNAAMVIFNGEGFPDFGGHSNNEIGILMALQELRDEGEILDNTVLFRWAGVWDRISAREAQMSIPFAGGECYRFIQTFFHFYRSQIQIAPVPNGTTTKPAPQSFAHDVLENAGASCDELLRLIDLPPAAEEAAKRGVLHYKVKTLGEVIRGRELEQKQEALELAHRTTNNSSNKALTGKAPYPQRLDTIDGGLRKAMLEAGVIGANELGLFGYDEQELPVLNGPTAFRKLGLPEELHKNLFDELYDRIAFTDDDARLVLAFSELLGAPQSTAKVQALIRGIETMLENIASDYPRLREKVQKVAIVRYRDRTALEEALNGMGIAVDNIHTNTILAFDPIEPAASGVNGIGQAVREIYINEQGDFEEYSYYPLPEIVLIALVKEHMKYAASEISARLKALNVNLDTINIEWIEEGANGALKFVLIPAAQRQFTDEEVTRYTTVKRLLESSA